MSDIRVYFRLDEWGQQWMSLDGADDDSHWWPVWLWDLRPEFQLEEDEIEALMYGPPITGNN